MNYDEYLMHLNRQFDESKVKRDKGGRFAKKAESRVDKKKRLGGFYDEVRSGNNVKTRTDLLNNGAASAVKNAKKRAKKETIRNKINSVIDKHTSSNIVDDGAASAVKNAKRRSTLRGLVNDKPYKKTRKQLQQPWKQQENKNTKQKIASAFASARTGKDKAGKKINAIKSKFGSYIDKLKGGTEQNLLNKGAASAVKRAKTKVTIKEAIKNAKGKFKEYAARGSAYLGRVRGAAYGAKPYVDKAIDNAKTAAKSGASKAYDTARQVGMNARDEASKIGKKVKSTVENKVDRAKIVASMEKAKHDTIEIAKDLAKKASLENGVMSKSQMMQIANQALNQQNKKGTGYPIDQLSDKDWDDLVSKTQNAVWEELQKKSRKNTD